MQPPPTLELQQISANSPKIRPIAIDWRHYALYIVEDKKTIRTVDYTFKVIPARQQTNDGNPMK